jgi:hypothetical protein
MLDLLQFYEIGFIPHPHESENEFCERVRKTKFFLSKKEDFLKKHRYEPKKIAPFAFEGIESSPFFYITQKKKPPFWIFAITHIIEEDGVFIPFLELREKKLFFAPSFEEVIAHEKIHMMRSHFNEPKFEEIIAYQTSPYAFRRYFGPLFQNIYESYVLLFLSLLMPMMNFFSADFAIYFSSLPIFYFSFLFVRLAIFQAIFKKAKTEISKKYRNAKEIMTFLMDKEIIAIAKRKNISSLDLRWRIIETFKK